MKPETENRLHKTDLEHVVRCRDCAYCAMCADSRATTYYCTRPLGETGEIEVLPEDFCSYGYPRNIKEKPLGDTEK